MYHRQDNNKWVKFDRVDNGFGCSISGTTVAIRSFGALKLYRYYKNQGTAALGLMSQIQDPIVTPIFTGGTGSFDVSNDNLVYWDNGYNNAIPIYKKDGTSTTSQTFAFHQKLDMDSPDSVLLTLDNDLLVVGGNNRTRVFSLQNDEWIETITLNQAYDDYRLSGRTLIATAKGSDQVYSFSIQDCVQDMPTQSPSMSMIPTPSPSVHPSTSPTSSPSMEPSTLIIIDLETCKCNDKNNCLLAQDPAVNLTTSNRNIRVCLQAYPSNAKITSIPDAVAMVKGNKRQLETQIDNNFGNFAIVMGELSEDVFDLDDDDFEIGVLGQVEIFLSQGNKSTTVGFYESYTIQTAIEEEETTT